MITTSPVPLGRTFTDSDVIVANNYSKSMLRTVAGELTTGSSDIDYYPSYEMVMMSENATSWHDDLRHVTDAKVGEVVMSFAAKIFPETQDSDALLRQRYAQASVKLGKREFSEAYAILTSLKAELGTDTGFLNDFCLAAERAGHHHEALQLHEQLDGLGDANPGRMIRRANVHIALGQHADALNFAEKSLLQHPNDFAPKLTMIDALIHLGRTEVATEMAEMILTKLRGPGDPDRHPRWVFSRLRKSFKALGKNQKVRAVVLLEKRNSSDS